MENETQHIHEKEVAEHNGHINKIISDQYRSQKAFGILKKGADLFISRMIVFVNIIQVRKEKVKKSYFRSRKKPEASRSTPASTMAIIAEIEGVFTVIQLKNFSQLA